MAWRRDLFGLWLPPSPVTWSPRKETETLTVFGPAPGPTKPVGKRGARRRRARIERPCRVYWGSHGCDKVRGHSGEHICSGCGPPWYLDERGRVADITLDPDKFFGEDVELYEALAMEC